jgi:hypothetical protein
MTTTATKTSVNDDNDGNDGNNDDNDDNDDSDDENSDIWVKRPNTSADIQRLRCMEKWGT